MIYVLGIDVGFASSPTGCALLWFDNEPRLLKSFSLRARCSGDWQERQYDILSQLDAALETMLRSIPSTDLLLAYACAHLRERKNEGGGVLNAQTSLKLAELAGGLRGMAVAHGLTCVGVQEAQSKVALTKDAHATKNDMIKAVERLFGKRLPEDEADAVGHALAGESAWRRARVIREAVTVS